MADGVLIIGAGASGTLLAIRLIERGARVILAERSPALAARGVAYGEAEPRHLLNVRAAGMSAFPEQSDHFSDWLQESGQGDALSFAPRRRYGDYLAALLADAARRHPDLLQNVSGDIVDVVESGGGVSARLTDGRQIQARDAVIAIGNLPPSTPPGIDPGLDPDLWIADPWGSDPAAGLLDDDHLVLVGTGLTAVDVALQLDASGFRGRITALSRRGLLPRVHADPEPRLPPPDEPASRLSQLLRDVRQRAQASGWRAAVDALRPITQSLWAKADHDTRRRFLRHLRPWWDVHRHRIAPQIGERLAAMIAEHRLDVVAARTHATRPDGTGVALTFVPRGTHTPKTIHVRRLINCTGPQADLLRSGDPLLRALRDHGTIRSGPLRIGLDVDNQLSVIRRDGAPSTRIHAIGPITRERFWEVVAVPDIRQQAATLAARLAPDQ